jgi:phage replication initiation protein
MSDSIPSLAGCQPAFVPVLPFPRVSLSSLGCPVGGQAGVGAPFELARKPHLARAVPPESEPTPASNTGVKVLRTASADDEGFSVCIDTLTFSFAGCLFGYDVGAIRSWFSRWSDGALSVGGRLSQRYNGYPECWDIVLGDGDTREAPSLGWVGMSCASDHMRGRCCIHLKAPACLLVNDWSRLRHDMPVYHVRITRCDIALDDYEGVHGIDEAKALWESGAFITSGLPPKSQQVINSDGSGDTFYVGSRSSDKFFRVYEKGRQLAGTKGKLADFSGCIHWVRWELELKGNCRVIPYDVLTSPLVYFKGAYPRALSWVVSLAVSIKTNLNKLKLTFTAMMTFAKHQVSRLVRYCSDSGMTTVDIVESLIADPGCYPLRLFDVERLDLSVPHGTLDCAYA